MSFPITPRNTLVPSDASPSSLPPILSRFGLASKTAIITGGGAGIGLSVARAFASVGCDLVLWYFKNTSTPSTAASLAQEFNVKVHALQVDVRDPSAVEVATNESVALLGGRLDIVIANAGIPWTRGPITTAENPVAHFRDVMATNVDGVFYTALSAGRIWARQRATGVDANGEKLPASYKGGSFVATASMSGHIVNVPQKQAVYNASKAAVLHLVKSLAVEWAEGNVARANTVSPGYMLTEISNFVPQEVHEKWQGMTPQGREGEPHELQGAYLYLASDASTYTTGADLVVDGGYCAP